MQYFLVILLIILSQSISAQVVKGGIDPNGPVPQERPAKILGGGPSLTLVNKLEEKIQRFRHKLHYKRQKCLGSSKEFKTLSEAVAFLNLQQSTSTHQANHSGECAHRGAYRCLLSPRLKKLMRTIDSDPVLEHYLIEHEDLSQAEFQEFKKSLKSHLGGHD